VVTEKREERRGEKEIRGPRDAEPDVVVRVAGRADAAVGRAHVDRVVAPAAAADHAERRNYRTRRVRLRVARVIAVQLVHPLLYVAEHVVEAERVRRLETNVREPHPVPPWHVLK